MYDELEHDDLKVIHLHDFDRRETLQILKVLFVHLLRASLIHQIFYAWKTSISTLKSQPQVEECVTYFIWS